jgi:hypothetical protein
MGNCFATRRWNKVPVPELTLKMPANTQVQLVAMSDDQAKNCKLKTLISQS